MTGHRWAPPGAPTPPPATSPAAEPPLDADVAALRARPGRLELAALLAVSWLVAIELVSALVLANVRVSALVAAGISLLLEASVGGAVVVAVLLTRPGLSWRRGLGLAAPQPGDARPVLAWVGVQFVARLAAAVLLAALLPGFAHVTSNNPFSSSVHHALIVNVILVVNIVMVAPFVEELLCRGLILRATMQRMRFAPAAAINALIFGMAHGYQQPSLQTAIGFTIVLGTFGALQCVLIRRSGRLGPVILVHGLTNAITLIIGALLPR